MSLAYAIHFQLSARASTGSVFARGSLSHLLLSTWLALEPWLVAWAWRSRRPPVIRRLRPHAVTLAVFAAMRLRGATFLSLM